MIKMKFPDDFVNKVICGDTLDILQKMPSECVDCIITSPPYWGLRDYGESTCKVWDGNPNCEHEFDIVKIKNPMDRGGKGQHDIGGIVGKMGKTFGTNTKIKSGFCKKCGAWYGQLGLEPTLDLYLKHLLQITLELKRVLKKTGVMFWNHGDCYGGSLQGWGAKHPSKTGFQKPAGIDERYVKGKPPNANITPKCMALQNYRLILRMIDEQGWILRNIIIWYKPVHMPSSVKDRFTNAYEPVFMLTKSKKYWFDLDAVRVPHKESSIERVKYEINKFGGNIAQPMAKLAKGKKGGSEQVKVELNPLGKNPGDVWEIPIQPFPEAHFAVYPEKLVEPMIKAGCPQWICKKCGKARVRISRPIGKRKGLLPPSKKDLKYNPRKLSPTSSFLTGEYNIYATFGWTDCGCNAGWEPGIVLDPFAGSGTTCLVAKKLARDYIGIEINPKYVEMAKKRINKVPKRLDKFIND